MLDYWYVNYNETTALMLARAVNGIGEFQMSPKSFGEILLFNCCLKTLFVRRPDRDRG
jgi:hypothetical protein